MGKTKEYKHIKNFIHNELGFSKQLLVDIVRDEIQKQIPTMLHQSFGKVDLISIVEKVVKVILFNSEVYTKVDAELSKMIKETVRENYEISLTVKKPEDNSPIK